MMKRFIFGVMLVVIGFIFSAFCFIYAVMNPFQIDGVTGLRCAFRGTYTETPFVISMITMLIGLFICFYEAYISKK